MGWRRNKLTLYASIPECPQVDILFNIISKEKITEEDFVICQVFQSRS